MPLKIENSMSVSFFKPPLVALSGPTGSGKTESAMRLARGYCGPDKKFLILDTEDKRALYKRDRYQPWDWAEVSPPFSPANMSAVLKEAGEAGYSAVILDSASSEYVDEGGLQDMAAETLERMCKGDYSKADALTMASWKPAKLEHKAKFMRRITRFPVLLILCLRAEPKVAMVKDSQTGKTKVVDAGWQPLAEKMFMYHMLVASMMLPDNPGVPIHVKPLEKSLVPVFPNGREVDESTGERLREWAMCCTKDESNPAALAAALSAIESMTDKASRNAAGALAGALKGADADKAKEAWDNRMTELKQASAELPCVGNV